MSINITVNGKFGKTCQRQNLLMDREKAKKDLEEERRKQRLLQVREQSKKMAEKIRRDVKEAKRKGLEKYEATKAEEFNAWRQREVKEKMKDYRDAVFQVGTAHRAANAEKKSQAEKQAKPSTYKEFKKKMAARRKNKENLQNLGPCICSKLHVCPNVQFQCQCYKARQQFEENQKRKRDASFSNSDSESANSEDETSNDETLKESTTSSSTSLSPLKSATTTASGNNRATQTSQICMDQKLRKTPAVFLDVEVESDDSELITAPSEIQDKHVQHNRQFNSVVRVSPKKQCSRPEDKNDKQMSASTISTERMKDIRNVAENKPATVQPVAKRFTLISDLVNKQQIAPKRPQQISPSKRPTTDGNICMSPNKIQAFPPITSRPPVARPISQPLTTPISPHKGSISSKSSKVIAGGHTQATSASAASANTVTMASTSSSSCRVQFFDYNSKLSRQGAQNQTNVRVNRQNETIQPSAMEQAAVETRLQYDKQQDTWTKSKQMEERCQKALEREQVRRDCNELTEKLEALTRQYPRQLPINENPPHIFVDKQLRKESKMNSAVEKLLNRPTIITCSEVQQNEQLNDGITIQKPTKTSNIFNEINVGATSKTPMADDDASSDSCCSILLGYVDDQSRQVRRDLEQWSGGKAYTEKQQRLKKLLQRLDQLRNSLLQELKTTQSADKEESKKPTEKEEHYLQLLDDISKYRQERENIMIDDVALANSNKETKSAKNVATNNKERAAKGQPLTAREKLLEQKEAILEKKLREFYELQKQQSKVQKTVNKKCNNLDDQNNSQDAEEGQDAENKENINCTTLETPVEIVITVQGESKCVKIDDKSKRKAIVKKPPTQLATLIKSPQTKRTNKKSTPRKKLVASNDHSNKATLGRQNSYDSNSTSYMSLPPQMHTQLADLVDEKQQQEHEQHSFTADTQTSTEFDDYEQENDRHKKPVPHLNPLVAQYVQRLLGMSRKTIQRLGVSSSDIDTPADAVIDTSDNNPSSDSALSDERLAAVESFVEENRSFIKELEQSLRAQNDTSLENSVRIFDHIWSKRLKEQPKTMAQKPRQKVANKAHSPRLFKKPQPKESHTKSLQTKEKNKPTKHCLDAEQRPISKPVNKPCFSKAKHVNEFDSSPEIKANVKPRRTSQKNEKALETQISNEATKVESDTQIERYAQLTENCTHRIAELTELINRVRQEKQRLLECTLSSVSDNGRQSTEYLELPDGKSRNTNEAESSQASSLDETTHNKATSLVDNLKHIPKLSALEKNRPINASQDSGIADSRPITAQENRTDIEPMSHTSTESQSTMQQRKLKPPPTLRRFSPQFQEDDLVHELSTILEVDTPANSRIHTAIAQTSEDRLAATMAEQLRQPIMFPTFEEYIQKLNLDITQLDEEQSEQLHHEFSQFIEDLQRSQTKRKEPQYIEFPSINGYISKSHVETISQAEDMDETLSQLRLNDLQPNRFPAVREYVESNKQANASPNEEQQLLDTESLENITDAPQHSNTENDSASIDIEKELKQRNILKNSFRYTNSRQIFSSTAHHSGGEFYSEIIEAESGVEKLSTSDNTIAMLETDLKRMVQQWPSDGKRKTRRERQLLSSSTTSTSQSRPEKEVKSSSLDESSNEVGRPLNLREFLTRELLKHANFSTSTSTSSSEDSLRSHFLNSLIGTLTPRTNAATSKSGQHTLERQKTSTPVPMLSSQTHSTSNQSTNTSATQLFSGESRISSVHGNERSAPRLQTSDGVNADQSSN